jgi:hypothetical protein
MTSQLPVPVRASIDRRFALLVLICLITIAAGGFLTYDAHIEAPETVTEEQTTGTWTVGSEFEHAATVQRETAVFPAGDRLENRSLYFTSVAPTLNATYILTQQSTGTEQANATIDVSLVISSVEEVDGDPVTHWQLREPLKTVPATTVSSNRKVVTAVQVDIQSVGNQTEAIRSDLGSTPGETRVKIVAETTVTGSVDGQSFTDTRTDRIQITPGASVYRASVDTQEPSTYEATTTVTQTVEPSPLLVYGGPSVLTVGVVGLLTFIVARFRGWLSISENERSYHRFTTTREDLDKWISTADIPSAGNREVARTATLEDLVDIAIDSGQRVLEDDNQYATIVEGVMYIYTAPKINNPISMNADIRSDTEREGPTTAKSDAEDESRPGE